MTSPLELLLLLGALAAACGGVVAVTPHTPKARAALLAMLGAVTAVTAASAFVLAARASGAPPLPSERPQPNPASTYVSSAACRGCHPGEHASFGRTFHRTMTQDANTSTVVAPLDAALTLDGRAMRLERRGDAVWARLPDPDVTPMHDAPDVERRVVLTTGSHREQAFWVAGKRAGELRLFPFVWVIAEARFVPRRDAFLSPPDQPLPNVRWNSNCIACHAVAGEPGHDVKTDAFTTRAAELGIACEACHGPGGAHVERHRDPFERYAQYGSKKPDPTIVHPGRIAPERSAAVCGQCHAYTFPRDEDGFWTSGYARAFRAGDALEPSRHLLSRDALAHDPGAPHIEMELDSLFWPDGSIRVGGREYNGLVASPCFERGAGARKMTCLSCHAMHRGDPAGQIAPERMTNAACTQCHDDERARTHAHHAPDSAGSRCIDCHMPKTSYALFSAVRSHRIDSPSAKVSLETGKPNACNLCHLDRSLAWTAERLTAWFGAAPVDVPAERAQTPEGVYLALAGDAAQRVLVADALGSKAARAASKDDPRAMLDELAVDSYAAIRFVAERSRKALVSAEDQRTHTPAAHDDRTHDNAISTSEPVTPERRRALRERRDERPITIAE